jgi:hypothetical protein
MRLVKPQIFNFERMNLHDAKIIFLRQVFQLFRVFKGTSRCHHGNIVPA